MPDQYFDYYTNMYFENTFDFVKDELDIIQPSSFERKKTDSKSILNARNLKILLLHITKTHINIYPNKIVSNIPGSQR